MISYYKWFDLFDEGTTKTDSGITLKGIATKAGIDNLNIFDQECSQKMLLNLSQHCVDWTLIGLYLDLTRADIAAVNGDYQTVDEKRAGMLGRWKESLPLKLHIVYLLKLFWLVEKQRTPQMPAKLLQKVSVNFQFLASS